MIESTNEVMQQKGHVTKIIYYIPSSVFIYGVRRINRIGDTFLTQHQNQKVRTFFLMITNMHTLHIVSKEL